MKVTITLAAIVLSLTTASLTYAEEPYYPISDATSVSSTITRAQILSKLQVAEAVGELQLSQQPYYPLDITRSTKTRAQVLSELQIVEASGELQSGPLPYYPGAVS
ncbi:DUF4148 domain-containing protein [Castellaniella sp. UC4442_H9]